MGRTKELMSTASSQGTEKKFRGRELVRLSIACLLIFLFCIVSCYAVDTTTPVVRIVPGETVYYDELIDCYGITGFNDTIAWWEDSDWAGYEEPDRVVELPNPHRFFIDRGLQKGMWFVWDGKIEHDNQQLVFVIKDGTRPYVPPTPTPTPVVLNTTRQPFGQPKQAADILQARFDRFYVEAKGPCLVWIFGPETKILGVKSKDTISSPFGMGAMNQTIIGYGEASFNHPQGTYTIFLQYPDKNGIYEIYGDGYSINSTWKDVPAIDTTPLSGSVAALRYLAMISDKDHFHGTTTQVNMKVLNPMVDIQGIDENADGTLTVRGITTLSEGSTLRVVFDEDRNPLPSDLKKVTFTTKAEGKDRGAYRIWSSKMYIDIQQLNVGAHEVKVYTPDGYNAVVEFHVYDQFAPFTPPPAHIKYVNYSYWIPTPTPEVIREVVTQIVTKIEKETVYVNVTPDYAVLQRKYGEYWMGVIGKAVLYLGLLGGFVYAGYLGIRMLKNRSKKRNEYSEDV